MSSWDLLPQRQLLEIWEYLLKQDVYIRAMYVSARDLRGPQIGPMPVPCWGNGPLPPWGQISIAEIHSVLDLLPKKLPRDYYPVHSSRGERFDALKELIRVHQESLTRPMFLSPSELAASREQEEQQRQAEQQEHQAWLQSLPRVLHEQRQKIRNTYTEVEALLGRAVEVTDYPTWFQNDAAAESLSEADVVQQADDFCKTLRQFVEDHRSRLYARRLAIERYAEHAADVSHIFTNKMLNEYVQTQMSDNLAPALVSKAKDDLAHKLSVIREQERLRRFYRANAACVQSHISEPTLALYIENSMNEGMRLEDVRSAKQQLMDTIEQHILGLLPEHIRANEDLARLAREHQQLRRVLLEMPVEDEETRNDHLDEAEENYRRKIRQVLNSMKEDSATHAAGQSIPKFG